MCFSLVIVFLFNPMVEKCKQTKGKKYHKLWWIYDIALIGMSCFICWYFLSHANWLNMRILTVDKMRPLDITVAVMLIFCVMEAVRRVVSLALFFVICFFMAYAYFGQYITGIFKFAGMSFGQFCETLMLGQNGIFGSPLSTSMGTLFYFMVFGAFFSNCGGGDVLIDCGMKLSDKTVGGPAHAIGRRLQLFQPLKTSDSIRTNEIIGILSGGIVDHLRGETFLTVKNIKRPKRRLLTGRVSIIADPDFWSVALDQLCLFLG